MLCSTASMNLGGQADVGSSGRLAAQTVVFQLDPTINSSPAVVTGNFIRARQCLLGWTADNVLLGICLVSFSTKAVQSCSLTDCMIAAASPHWPCGLSTGEG
jgi:hypothetical protein